MASIYDIYKVRTVDASGNPVSAGGGDASAANQTAGNASLASINTKLPAALGPNTAANSLPVTLSTDGPFPTLTGAVTETAPATDIASSGLNGRLQRIAQRLTTIISGLLVYGSGACVKVALTVSTTPAYSAGDSIGGKITIANAVRALAGRKTRPRVTSIRCRASLRPCWPLVEVYSTQKVRLLRSVSNRVQPARS